MTQTRPQPARERRLLLFFLGGLFFIGLFHTLRTARELFLPLLLAFFLSFALRPLVRLMKRVGVPDSVGAALVLLALVLTIVGGVSLLADPAAEWLAKAPASIGRAQGKLKALRRPMERIGKTADQVQTTLAGGPAAPAAPQLPAKLSEAVLLGTEAFVSATLIVIVLLYFLLASGDLFLRKLVDSLQRQKDKQRAIEISRVVEDRISRYLATISLINLGVGVAVALGVWLLGMPNPILWGVMAGALTYVPYLGAIVGVGILALASLLTFDDLGQALSVPSVYVVVTFIEANFVSPAVLGARLALNPVAVFVALIVWSFLWGVPGMLLAVPILSVCKIVCENVEGLSAVAEFLGPDNAR